MSGKKKFRAPTAAPASTASNAATPLESVESFSFMECLECHNNGRWYEPPISPYGLARMFDVAAYHQSPLIFKRNVIASCYIPHPLLTRQEFTAWVQDYLIFGNCYMECRRNRLGQTIELRPSQAKYTRRGIDPDQVWFVPTGQRLPDQEPQPAPGDLRCAGISGRATKRHAER